MLQILSYLLGLVMYWIMEKQLDITFAGIFISKGWLAHKPTNLSTVTAALIDLSPFLVSHAICALTSSLLVGLVKYKDKKWIVGVFFVVTGALPFLLFSSHNDPLVLIVVKVVLFSVSVYAFSFVGALAGSTINRLIIMAINRQ